ncbi:TetR/AcrR family transcriptional regulator [Sciscionella sediminilitoris]|uniref:TetR/AcrR family transcriptional regulator n=1 Tax=Sciscionella sediminilitoris TaxID=1445613 RepID=UPI000565D1D0|nr:TetR family transcriptional regulator [Sciscionella sp. SE31]
MDSARRAGRPSTAILSKERIVDAAFAVLRESGTDKFSMTRVAEALSVRVPALYNHFRNKTALVDAMREQVAKDIDATPFDRLPWDEAVVPWAWSYRDAFAARPAGIDLLAATPVDTPQVAEDYERISRGLRRGGWPLEEIVDVIVTLESFVIGSALDALAPADNLRLTAAAEHAPEFVAAERTRAAKPGIAADRTFEIGLRVLVSGLRLRLAELTG